MHRKLQLLLLPGLCLLLIAASLFFGGDYLDRMSNIHLPFHHEATPSTVNPGSNPSTTPTTGTATVTNTSPAQISAPVSRLTTSPTIASPAFSISNGIVLSADRISAYVSAILDSTATNLPRLECPALDTNRYDILRKEPDARESIEYNQIDYFFALNLHECIHLLPRLLGSIVEAIRFLGPYRCALSIVEGNSPDGTGDILMALSPFLEDIGVAYFFNNSKINPSKGARIHKLAQLRNLALTPLYNKKVRVTEGTTVLFINDVAACAEDLLELLLQRRSLEADMACAMDWTYVGQDPTFYDIWVARTIQGDSFFEVGADGNWNSAWNLFWNAPQTRSRYDANLPFQVFACWNGATAFTAAPLLHGLRFRDVHGDKGECFQGEPQLFCKDLWHRGYRKIAVVPTVNLEYSDERGADIKQLKGYVSELIANQEEGSYKISWVFNAPEQVRCMPDWGHQSWRPWNETLR